jgi:hypothetical protein
MTLIGKIECLPLRNFPYFILLRSHYPVWRLIFFKDFSLHVTRLLHCWQSWLHIPVAHRWTLHFSGEFPDELHKHMMGPLCHSRWFTTASRVLRLYVSGTCQLPWLGRFANYVVNVYFKVKRYVLAFKKFRLRWSSSFDGSFRYSR